MTGFRCHVLFTTIGFQVIDFIHKNFVCAFVKMEGHRLPQGDQQQVCRANEQ